MSVLIFLAVLFVLVLVHEFGHFIVAKWTGMRVDEFGIGFPPKLFGIRRGETEYTLNLFPIGGFVKIRGEDGVRDPSARLDADFSEQREGKSPSSGQPRYEEDGVKAADGVTATSNDSRSFVSKSKWAQSAVLLAGVTMNILFAWFLVAIAFSLGVQSNVSEEEASPTATLIVTSVLSSGPAGIAGLPEGAVIHDAVVAGQSLKEKKPSVVARLIKESGGAPVTIAYSKEGELQLLEITPKSNVIDSEPDRLAIGVTFGLVDTIVRNPFEAIRDSFLFVITGLRDISVGIAALVFDAVRLKADFSQVAGPVGIAGLVGEASAIGITSLLLFTAFISLNLAVINILPFPALDGGRLLIVFIEGIKRSPVNQNFVGILNTVGFFALILLMIAVTWSDIAKLM